MLQECHGAPEELSNHLQFFDKQFLFHATCISGNRTAGGLITLLSRSSFSSHTVTQLDAVSGRAMRITATLYSSSGVLLQAAQFGNVHNYDLDSPQTRTLVDKIRNDVQKSKNYPCVHFTLLSGDLNLPPPHESPLVITNPSPLPNSSANNCSSFSSSEPPNLDNRTSQNRPHVQIWQPLFNQLLELESGQHSHFDSKSNSTSTLTRIFCSVPPSAAPSLVCTGGLVQTPIDLWAKQLSDHAPVTMSISARSKHKVLPLRLKPERTKHPMYAGYFHTLFHDVDFNLLPTSSAFFLAKQGMREAGLKVRDHLFDSCPKSALCVLARLSSIAKAVWTKDLKLAELLINKSELAAKHVDISSGSPVLVSQPDFELQFREAKSKHLDSLKAKDLRPDLTSREQNKKAKSRIRRLDNMQKLWLPRTPRLVLGSVTCDQEIPPDFCAFPTPQLRALAFFYSQVFCGRPIDLSQARSLLRVYAKNVTWEWELAKPLSLELVSSWLARARGSTPGWDGVPYSAWRGLGLLGAELLHRLMLEQSRALPPPPASNYSMWHFPPQKALPTDPPGSNVVVRSPCETRPLALLCTDNKSVSATSCSSMAPVTVSCTSDLQRGFVPGRQILQNVLELDTVSRIHAFRCMSSRSSQELTKTIPAHSVPELAVAALFDFFSAFHTSHTLGSFWCLNTSKCLLSLSILSAVSMMIVKHMLSTKGMCVSFFMS